MTKPETSKLKVPKKEKPDEIIEEIQIATEIEPIPPLSSIAPKTAKDLFAVFAPKSDTEEEEDPDDANDEKTAEDMEDVTTGEPLAKKKRFPPKKYNKLWENKPDLKPWLSASIHGDTYFYCKFCKNDYKGGVSDIYKHMSSKKHMLKGSLPSFNAQKFKFRGLLCPVFTPFCGNSRLIPAINPKAIPKYANYLAACNVKGILVNDLVGEGMSLSLNERVEILNAWCAACHKTNQFLMVQVGGASFKEVVEMVNHAVKKDVGAIVVLPDLYNKPNNHLDLIKYMRNVAEFTGKVPILYHHNPTHSRIEIDINEFLLDITGEIDTFVGLIYSTNDAQQVIRAAAAVPGRYTIFMGTEEVILGAAASGLTCIMSASLNFLPKLVEAVIVSLKENKVKEAQRSQTLLNRALDVIVKEGGGDMIVGMKNATEIITNRCGAATRAPLLPLWEGTVKKLKEKLHEVGVV